MARKANSETYFRVRRWADHDIANRYRPVSIFIPFFATLIATTIALRVEGAASAISWMVALLGAVCLGFVLWRAVRLFRVLSIKGDRVFDQKDKFFLSPEYHRSESVTAAAQRKRSQRRRLL